MPLPSLPKLQMSERITHLSLNLKVQHDLQDSSDMRVLGSTEGMIDTICFDKPTIVNAQITDVRSGGRNLAMLAGAQLRKLFPSASSSSQSGRSGPPSAHPCNSRPIFYMPSSKHSICRWLAHCEA